MNQKLVILLVLGCFTYTDAANDCGPTEDQPCAMRCQSEADGVLLPVATACTDQRTDCEFLFTCDNDNAACVDGTVADAAFDLTDEETYPKIRSVACDNPDSQDIALQCASTCQICCETPEYNCEDDDTGVVDCQANINKCTDSSWVDIMSQYCPATCGLCLSGSCSDINSGCNDMKSLCRDIDFNAYMSENCARTCDACSSSTSAPGGGSCTDIASNCAQNSALCTNTVYFSLMQSQCACTCQGASNSGGGNSCTDSNSNCANWVRNGFCNSSFYTTAQKREYCGRSCNLC